MKFAKFLHVDQKDLNILSRVPYRMGKDDFFRPIPREALLSIDITFNAVEYNYVNTYMIIHYHFHMKN